MTAPTFGTIYSVSGYWMGPPIWFGSAHPEKLMLPGLPQPEQLSAYRRTFAAGGGANATESGLVFIDFTGLEPSDFSDKDLGNAPFPSQSRTLAVASLLAPRHVEMLNAHQLCLLDAIGARESKDDFWSPDPRPVTVATLWSGQSDDRVGVQHQEEVAAYLRFVQKTSTFSRQAFTFSAETLDQSFTTFEKILAAPEVVIRACHCLLLADDHYRHWRFDQSLMLSWAASEALFTQLWIDHASAAADAAGHALNAKRRTKLVGADFTASIILEVLAIAGVIDRDLYNKLSAACAMRNKWVHGLESVPDSVAAEAFFAGQELVRLLTECDLDVPVTLISPRLF